MHYINNWMDIEAEFTDGLILGNGASIALHDGFRYSSLYSEAARLGFISHQVADIFRKFGVDDFEEVLRKLWQTKLVLQALELPHTRISESYHQVRSALISTVRRSHITRQAADPHLPHIYRFMKRFKTVVSLNYDLIVYWAAMAGNSELDGVWFKDGFQRGGGFGDDWKRLRESYGGAEGATLYFYPHGNLALKRTNSGEGKVVSQGNDLLYAILSEWEGGGCVPLFVCEGTSNHKKKAIGHSAYLQRVFSEVLPDINTSLVIYGWGMSDQDQHIVDQLRRAPPSRAAVSLRGGNQALAANAEQRLHDVGVENVIFFDSASPGCWNNPPDLPDRQIW